MRYLPHVNPKPPPPECALEACFPTRDLQDYKIRRDKRAGIKSRLVKYLLFTDIQQCDPLKHQIPDAIMPRRSDLFRCDIEKGHQPGGFLR